jgi:hypothetical protein
MKRSYRSPDTTALEKGSCQAHSFILPTLQLGVSGRELESQEPLQRLMKLLV